ncbi:MAG TPA: SDR family oxidoreductase [Candidatus Methylacidiphilales bacterium]|nr:SDR family oxidoreductase [Candidatus Methylacidiphilales bacterium]
MSGRPTPTVRETPARNGESLNETAALAKQAGAEPLALPLDLRQPEAAKTLVDSALNQFGHIDAVVNIAGAVPQVDILEMTDAQWDDGLAMKLHGARRITVHAWNALKESKGSVIFMSGNSAQALKSAYGAVGTINAAIVAMARAGEIMATVQTAILTGTPYTPLRDAIIAHPTMTEGLVFLLLAVPAKS